MADKVVGARLPPNTLELRLEHADNGQQSLLESKMAVRVLFFERGASGVLQKSEAGMARWLKGPPLQESDGGRVVSCEPKVGAGAKYAGYAWQIYYEGELQDERIQPASLRGVLREMPRS